MGTLIKVVQSEVQGVVISVEGGTKEVEQGCRIATEVNERLGETARLAQAVRSIAETAEATEENSKRSCQAAEELRKLAEELSSSLSRFRLPS